MKNQLQKLTLVILSALLIVSCTKEDVSLPTVSKLPDTIVKNPVATLVYIYNNDVHTINSRGLRRRQITFNQNARDEISLSYDLTKIAYISTNKIPVIINMNGEVIDSLVDYPFSSELHWAPNNETLLFNCNDSLKYWGPDLNLKHLSPAYPYGYRRGFALSKNMDYAYSYKGNIYYQKAKYSYVETIYTNYDGVVNTHLKFNYNGDKLYFSNDYGRPVIKIITFINDHTYIENKLDDYDFNRYRQERFYGFNKDESEIYVEVWDEEMGYNIYILNKNWYKDANFSRYLLDSTTPYHNKIPFDAK